MLSLKNVTHVYGEHTVLKNMTFAFPARGIVALMGASGIGKTTLLRLICGLETPTVGEVENTYRKTAVSFQEPRLIPNLTCLRNLTFVMENERAYDTARILLNSLELRDYENEHPSSLSGGMQQRLSLARALSVGADLLLLDEPFSALDAALKSRVISLVKAANPNGLTLVITHDKAEAEALGATVILLENTPVTALIEEKKGTE